MDAYIIWLIVAFAILGFEMLLGTIYLLAFFVGSLCAALVAFFGAGITTQAIVGAIVCTIGVVIAHFIKEKQKNKQDPADNLDEGQLVHVDAVLADGSAKVKYRGALWTAYLPNGVLSEGNYHISKVVGSRLELKK